MSKISCQQAENEIAKSKKTRVSERFISATFADIPAPELPWEQMPTAPVPRLDGYSIQIKNLFYVFSGYGTLDHVSSILMVLDFQIFKCISQFLCYHGSMFPIDGTAVSHKRLQAFMPSNRFPFRPSVLNLIFIIGIVFIVA